MKLPALFIRIESLVIFAATVFMYFSSGYNGWLFLLLFFTPDLSLLGYLIGPKAGAIGYNIVHNFALPVIGLLIGMIFYLDVLPAYCLIWAAHVGFDRTIGFGLMKSGPFGNSNVATIELGALIRRLRQR